MCGYKCLQAQQGEIGSLWAGTEKFNTGEIDKAIVNIYGHLQGHVQRGLNDLENETNAILRQKADVGAFIRGENAYSIVKCSFKDNEKRPKTVTDVKLSVNGEKEVHFYGRTGGMLPDENELYNKIMEVVNEYCIQET